MEIQATSGFKAQLSPNKPFLLGRRNGPNPEDKSISRAHISLSLTTPSTVTFRVIGKNPVWVSAKHENDGKVKVFNGSEMGVLSDGDMFCLSFQHPVWFTVGKLGGESEGQDGNFVGYELSQSLESGVVVGDGVGEFELGSFDISHFDPVQDFGFLVIGHEFDRYKKQINHDMKKWNWFLEDTRGENDDNGDKVPNKRGGRRKRKKAKDDDIDEEWTGESDDEVAVTTKGRKVHKPKYHTRSKDPAKKDGESTKKTSREGDEEEIEDEETEEDDEDETLGGFIVDEDENEMDEDEVDEEEEEFVEDEVDD